MWFLETKVPYCFNVQVSWRLGAKELAADQVGRADTLNGNRLTLIRKLTAEAASCSVNFPHNGNKKEKARYRFFS